MERQRSETVIVGREGRVTLPAKVRKALDVSPGDPLLISFNSVLRCLMIRPAKAEPRTYSDEHLASLARAFEDEKLGRLVEPTREYIADLVREKETEGAVASGDSEYIVKVRVGEGGKMILDPIVSGGLGETILPASARTEKPARAARVEAARSTSVRPSSAKPRRRTSR